MKKKEIGVLLLFLSLPSVARAQTYNDLQIQLGAYLLTDDGGEQPVGVWRSTGPIAIGKAVPSTYSFGRTCDAFAVSSDGSLREDATIVWKIDMTPIRVAARAVTFRLRWVRQQPDHLRSESREVREQMADVQLTLRPGESWPVDSIPVPAGAKTVEGRRCGSSVSIRASVDNYPSDDVERRLIGADLWLVEQLPNGAEAQRSQPISVRGLPNRPLAFYFDAIVDASVPLDIYGMLTARIEGGATGVLVETRCRWGSDPSSSSVIGPQRFVRSDLLVQNLETVEIRLPALAEAPGSLAKRSFSIRLRARPLR